MSVVVEASSPEAAEATARALRLAGFPARTVWQGESCLLVVTCVNQDRPVVLALVKRADAGCQPLEPT
jgi:hypothetical protein